MPSLNVGQYIRECMESVVNQTLNEIEIICVDARSTDGTLEIIQEYAIKDNRIKIINSDKKSYGYQMNLGIKASRGEYIGIVETDDFIDLNMYEELYKIAVKNNVDFIKENYNCFQYKENEILIFPYNICSDCSLYERRLINEQKKVLLNSKVVIWSSIYKRDFIIKNKILFNESPGASYQDNGFWFISSVLASNVYFHNNSHYYLRRDNPNSSVMRKDNIYSMCGEYDYIYNFLRTNKQSYDEYISVYWKALFYNYLFTLKRIHRKFKKEFLKTFSLKIKEGFSKKEIDLSLFNQKEKNMLKRIAYFPNSINTNHLKLRPVNAKEENYLKRLLYCYEDNGLSYTIKHIFERILKRIINN